MIPRPQETAANQSNQVDPHYDGQNNPGHAEPRLRGALLLQLDSLLSQLRDADGRSSR